MPKRALLCIYAIYTPITINGNASNVNLNYIFHTQKRYTPDTTNTEKVERVTNKMSTKCAVRTEGEEERNVLCFRTKFCRENPTTIFTTLRISQFEGRMVSYHEFTYSLHILKE